MRSDKTARFYRAALTLAATLIWIKTDLFSRLLGGGPRSVRLAAL